VVFNAKAETLYRIAVDGYSGATGSVVLNKSLTTPTQVTFKWSNPGGGDWRNVANWTDGDNKPVTRPPGGLTGTNDYVAIDLAKEYSVILNMDASVAGLTLGAASRFSRSIVIAL
jgi:hypothetical protein